MQGQAGQSGAVSRKPFADLVKSSPRSVQHDHLSSLERKYNLDRAQLDRAIDTVEYGRMLTHSEQMDRHKERVRAVAGERRQRKQRQQESAADRLGELNDKLTRTRNSRDGELKLRQDMTRCKRQQLRADLAGRARDINDARRREVFASRRLFHEQGEEARLAVMRKLGVSMPTPQPFCREGAAVHEPSPPPRGLPPARPYRRHVASSPGTQGSRSPVRAIAGSNQASPRTHQPLTGAHDTSPPRTAPVHASRRTAAPATPERSRRGKLTQQAVEAATEWLRWKSGEDRRRERQQQGWG